MARNKSVFIRIAIAALLAAGTSLASASVLWDFENNADSNLGTSPSGDPNNFSGNGDSISANFINPGWTGASLAAYEITGSHGSSGFCGTQLYLKSNSTTYNAGQATAISFYAKASSGSVITSYGVTLQDASGGYAFVGAPFTVTTSWQHFSIPISGAAIHRDDNNGTFDVSVAQSLVFRPGATGSLGLDLDDVFIDGVEGSPYVPPVVTSYDMNFDNGTSIAATVIGSGAGDSSLGYGDDSGNYTSGAVNAAVVGTQLQTSGAYTSISGANFWYTTLSFWFQSNHNYCDLSQNPGAGIEYTISKYNVADTTLNWFMRVEDTAANNYQDAHPQLLLDGQPHVIPLTAFTTFGTDPQFPSQNTQGSRTSDLTHAINITILTEQASQLNSTPSSNPPAGSYTQTNRLSVDRVRLVNGAGVSDWTLY